MRENGSILEKTVVYTIKNVESSIVGQGRWEFTSCFWTDVKYLGYFHKENQYYEYKKY